MSKLKFQIYRIFKVPNQSFLNEFRILVKTRSDNSFLTVSPHVPAGSGLTSCTILNPHFQNLI